MKIPYLEVLHSQDMRLKKPHVSGYIYLDVWPLSKSITFKKKNKNKKNNNNNNKTRKKNSTNHTLWKPPSLSFWPIIVFLMLKSCFGPKWYIFFIHIGKFKIYKIYNNSSRTRSTQEGLSEQTCTGHPILSCTYILNITSMIIWHVWDFNNT